jgi:benzoate-CoA ligase
VPGLSQANHSVSPPAIDIPRNYNAAHDLLERNLTRSAKVVYIDDAGRYTYGELSERVNRAANVLHSLGLRMEERIMLVHLDTIDFPAIFLGAIKAGIVPIPVNTLLTAADYRFMLEDSRACAIVISEALLPALTPALQNMPFLRHVIVSGAQGHGHAHLQALSQSASPTAQCAPTTRDDVCFWLYSSGSTGKPKGTLHLHCSLIQTAELYARPVLGIREEDVVLSAAKLFFAYGLGNALTFPLAVGASAVLMTERPTPAAVFERLKRHRPTIFYGVPTLYAAMLAHAELPRREELALRVCVSAGEALPPDIGQRWSERFDIDLLDGIGSTEMLHIFLSNRPGAVRYGTTGQPVPGYAIRLVDEYEREVEPGEIGELQISGPTSAVMYWNNRAKSLATFAGAWTRAGDKYTFDGDGYYTYCGRSDDMFKVSGMFVSPFEVEAALMTHPAVLEAAVVACPDEQELLKPKAYVVTRPGVRADGTLSETLKQHVKSRLAPFKYPRWIEFLPELPKTATGKIQRFKLRGQN